MILKVGLFTTLFTPRPFASPFVKVVLPAPRSPSKIITSCASTSSPSFSDNLCAWDYLLLHISVKKAPTLLPKLRGHFAEFLNNQSSLAHLRILSSPTCVGLRYRHLYLARSFSWQRESKTSLHKELPITAQPLR